MNVREYALLETLNIASTIYAQRHPVFRFEATAVQVANTLATDERLIADFGFTMSPRQISARFAIMALGRPRRPEPLVKAIVPNKWALTQAGCKVMLA